MPAAGRKPNTGQPIRHRTKPVHDWTEVDAVRFDRAPKLPKTQPNGMPWPAWTLDWWKAVSTMPHCALWEDEDWRFAIDTASVAAVFHGGDIRVATELRNREKVMGTTMDFRRDLRIRYVDPKPKELPASVKAIDDYRKMVE